ncbi:adenylate/guanylate cyclase domain-containing protein [Tropicimonas sp. IMCC34043]|uniref:adenylate/guanylate cyclase domain-containing protein n=1 Tax=Tropicimonas sp. IMCC34043 TaxID=2248760 RepID=UPI0013009116|nr:adenylate/guanylate cyclase domain-containing protein [Tropicimonas sp. IMCC34043]
MAVEDKIRRRAMSIRIAQRLFGPAEAIAGFQDIVLEELRKSGPDEALADALKVQAAAHDLLALVAALKNGEVEPGDKTRLRHDLRTPVNAILGYSELIVEDFGDRIAPSVLADIRTVTGECAILVSQIDRVLDTNPDTAETTIDALTARSLEQTLSLSRTEQSALCGRILVVDDTAQNRDLLKRQLVRQGHEVTLAASATEALALVETGDFDLALVDILMPDLNGIELLGRLKAHQDWRQIPVIMVSGLNEIRAVTRCIEAGAEDYLEKPVDPVLLESRVRACLERRRWQLREREYVARIEYERDRADALLHAMLPAPVIRRLRDGEDVIADRFEVATIVFADIVGFTPLVASIDPAELVQRLTAVFLTFDDIADRHGVEKIKTIGDAYMAACGVPVPRRDHAHRAFDFARDMIRATEAGHGGGLSIRVGLHSGPVIAGLVGRVRFVYDVWGATVNLASRLEASGVPGRIHLSGDARRLLADRLIGEPEARTQNIKGVGVMTTYLVD